MGSLQAEHTTTAPVLICGAGPTGLILALSLLLNGVRPRLIDSSTTSRIGSKAIIITPRSQELYRMFGVLADIQAEAIQTPSNRVYSPGSAPDAFVERELYPLKAKPTPYCPYTGGLTLPQDKLEAILQSHLTSRFGFKPECGVELVDFEHDHDRVVVRLQKIIHDGQFIQETVDFDVLVGCDGGKSRVRKHLGWAFDGITLPGALIYGDVHVKGLSTDFWHTWGDASDLLVGLWPISKDPEAPVAFRCFGKRLGAEEASALAQDPESLAKYATAYINRPDLNLGAFASLTTFQTNVRMTATFSTPAEQGHRVLLAGDAAHTHSPAGGQGLNASVQDALNLGWKIALVLRGEAPRTMLGSYSTERVPVIKEMLEETTKAFERIRRWRSDPQTVTGPGPEAKGDGGGKPAPPPPDFTQLAVHCRGSPIVIDELSEEYVDSKPAHGPMLGKALRAGDRAPDAPVALLNAKRKTLFDIFSPSSHTALLFLGHDSLPHAANEIMSALLPARRRGLVRTVLVMHSSASLFDATRPLDVDEMVEDWEGHVALGYAPERLGAIAVAVVRPDGVIGAFVRTANGVRQYLNIVFTMPSI